MKYVPHDYQQYATDYIETHPIAAVLLDMGLGKTAITLTALLDLLFDSFEAHRVLVIAPLRVARDTWPAEIEKWDHLKLLTYSVAVGTEKERKEAVLAEIGKFFIDIAKLVFGGIILASIMKIEVNKSLLFILGGIAVVAFALAGLLFIALSKSKR